MNSRLGIIVTPVALLKTGRKEVQHFPTGD